MGEVPQAADKCCSGAGSASEDCPETRIAGSAAEASAGTGKGQSGTRGEEGGNENRNGGICFLGIRHEPAVDGG